MVDLRAIIKKYRWPIAWILAIIFDVSDLILAPLTVIPVLNVGKEAFTKILDAIEMGIMYQFIGFYAVADVMEFAPVFADIIPSNLIAVFAAQIDFMGWGVPE